MNQGSRFGEPGFPSSSVPMANPRLLREAMKRTTYWDLWDTLVKRGRGSGHPCESVQGGCGEGASQLPPITYFSLFSGQFLEELSKFSLSK